MNIEVGPCSRLRVGFGTTSNWYYQISKCVKCVSKATVGGDGDTSAQNHKKLEILCGDQKDLWKSVAYCALQFMEILANLVEPDSLRGGASELDGAGKLCGSKVR